MERTKRKKSVKQMVAFVLTALMLFGSVLSPMAATVNPEIRSGNDPKVESLVSSGRLYKAGKT